MRGGREPLRELGEVSVVGCIEGPDSPRVVPVVGDRGQEAAARDQLDAEARRDDPRGERRARLVARAEAGEPPEDVADSREAGADPAAAHRAGGR